MKITAYHGTPFDFEYFDIDYLGYSTGGEGTSHGFFFAEEKAHAEYWAERNSLELQTSEYKILICEIEYENLFIADMNDYKYIDDIVANAGDCDLIKIINTKDDESGEERIMYLALYPENINIIKKEC